VKQGKEERERSRKKALCKDLNLGPPAIQGRMRCNTLGD